MLKNKKIKTLLIFVFFIALLLLTITSMDLIHIDNCHERDCKRCETIHNSINLLNIIKSAVLIVLVLSSLTYVVKKIVIDEIRQIIISPVKMKVMLIE